jgi:hypothetical protein
MNPDIWRAVVVVCVVGAVGLTAAALKKRSTAARVGLSILAAVVVAGLMGSVRPVIEQALFNLNDDFAWSTVRRHMTSKYPTLGELITLDPAIEKEFKAALLPVIRKYDAGEPAMFDASAAATGGVIAKHILPVAVSGSTEAVNVWGNQTTRVMRVLAGISDDACAEYATTGITRNWANPQVSAALQDAQRALIEAYKTSDRSKYPLPDQAIADAQFAKAARLAQPPFSDEELRAAQAIERQPKARQCALTLRFFEAIDRLDARGKSIIFRTMMSQS